MVRLTRFWSRSVLAMATVCLFTASSWAATITTITHGTLVANDRDDIYDSELKALINQYIPTYGSMILGFTQCYAGDTAQQFAGMTNTAILNGGLPGKTTVYGGYHRGLAQNLKPGTDTDSAHTAASGVAKPGDTPNKTGTNQQIGIGGAIQSTHVLVWAGKPNAQDQADINNVKANFPAGPNQSVTVLSGDGTGANTDGTATRANLKQALKNIGAKMNANEQFILFVTDHGDIDKGKQIAVTGGTGTGFINIPTTIVQDIQSQTAPDPQLVLISNISLGSQLNQTGEIMVNGHPIYDSIDFPAQSFFDIFTEISFSSTDNPTPNTYHYVTKPGVITPGLLIGNDTLENNVVTFSGFGPSSFFDVFVSLDSGAISRVPEPASGALLTLAGTIIATRRRRAA